MVRTFIYGIPHGFDFYEKDVELNDYFKGFYISSRRGRRLLINRRDNGETIYSYLRYGLKEVKRQPLHAFFGMSLVIDNYQYCPNFKVLLEWFDYLFNKMVNEHNIVKQDEEGIFHYVIHKFDENPTDVEWLKSNMPNIMTHAGQTDIVNYDSSFVDGKAGQVVSFNNPVSEKRLLETFKKYRWISVSADITDKEENSSNLTDSVTIELNYEELSGRLNEFNQQLLPIAVDISKGSQADLKRMSNDVVEINTSLSKYLPTIDNHEERVKFESLGNKYDSLKASIGTLLLKMMPQPETKYCFSCKQEKSLSHFHSHSSSMCIECEGKQRGQGLGHNAFKICVICGKHKPISSFSQAGSSICDICANSQKTVSKNGYILGALALVVVIAGIAFAALKFMDDGSGQTSCGEGGECIDPASAVIDPASAVVEATDTIVSRQELDRLVASGDFKAVYEYMNDKKDASNYKGFIMDVIKKYLWDIVDSSEPPLEELQEFYIKNNDLLGFIGFGENEKKVWSAIVEDYNNLCNILKKIEITKDERTRGYELFERHSGIFPEELYHALSEKPLKTATQERKDVKPAGETNPFTMTYIQASDGNELRVDIDGKTKNIGYDGLVGTNVKVVSNHGKNIIENGKKDITIVLKEEGKKYTINLDNQIVLTITAMRSKRSFNE